MRIANLSGRLVLLRGGGAVDVERASSGRFGADPQAVYEYWEEFTAWAAGWAAGAAEDLEAEPYDVRDLGAPVPRPHQVLAIGLNYKDHTDENDVAVPELPTVFTKSLSALTGPQARVRLPEGDVDFEAELVAVIGKKAWQVEEADAWSYVAGLTIGQDLSERVLQFTGPAPQWGPAKSHPGFAPLGPAVVTLDEFADPADLEIGCSVNGEQMQKDRTSRMIHPIPAFLAWVTRIMTLLPGDIIFTGTPGGVGLARDPRRFLASGDELVTWVEGIGEIRQTFTG
ncbi:fumarylacetoacetate hydrolase family protein [Streptomyces tubercidicus]|uniref:fumarylacetoacetate hydrolase family protein n=1 Tax=Streptomyces tubercidicus TaxID=47759 RepID=UPI00379F5AD4